MVTTASPESPRDPAEEPSRRGRGVSAYRRMGDAWMIATILPAAIGLGYLIGTGLDRLFGCYPWGTIAFSALGIVAGFREVIRIALRVGREEDEAARHGGERR